ncbi:MAG: hypothetical protein AB1782_08955, partial [Cyanobacteriota bacterium]
MVLLTELSIAQTTNNIEPTLLSKLEKIYNISPEQETQSSRLEKLEIKSIGLNNKGTFQERLSIVEKTYNDQISNCLKPVVEPIYTPVIKTPEKNKKNPLEYEYKPEYGNYFEAIKDSIVNQKYNLEDYHFKKFPIKYYIESSNPEWLQQIRLSLN